MGEPSKTSGEVGEKIARGILDTIGWVPRAHNVSVACSKKSHKSESGGQRKTHGVDEVFLYNSPFADDRTEVVQVSVKHVAKYPGQVGLRTTLKEHLAELNETIECAKHSPEIYELVSNSGSKKIVKHSGLLVWIHNDIGNIEHDIKPALTDVQISRDINFPIYLIDNARATFLLKAVHDLTGRSPNGMVEFYYPSIGTNILVDENRFGPILPIEMVASDIVVGLVRAPGGNELALYANQSFSQDTYRRLTYYALQFANGLVDTVRIGLPDYNAAVHERDVAVARQPFAARREKVEPFTFSVNVLSLLGEKQ